MHDTPVLQTALHGKDPLTARQWDAYVSIHGGSFNGLYSFTQNNP
jgi:hypothetical protein